ncbi:SDR family NAD(P)-dependent oxidoreductase [Psychromarinibacter sp. S121]|uniref:SDR family NAD(P)-dependent oxidoreductase n=1 Tax=Psychromarinibacter sp. S121 TaxID=3415127 RepID=UPI003C7E7512
MSLTALFGVEGRVAFVTGAAQGLGRAMVTALVQNGARVGCFDADAKALTATVDALGPEALALTGDVTDEAAVTDAVDRTVKAFGPLDIAVCNAGISDPDRTLAHRTGTEGWQRTLDVNLTGTFHTCRAALGQMLPRGRGKIVTVASMWGLSAPAGLQPRPAYAASKGAVVNLTRELAVEYAPHGIQVNALCPGFFRTETRPSTNAQADSFRRYTPMGRIAEADEIAGSLIYLCSAASDFVTGTTLVVDGGVLAR